MKIQKAKVFAGVVVAALAVGGLVLSRAASTHAVGSLLAYWKFDESSAGQVAVDESGNHNDLTPVNDPQPSTDRPSELDMDFADPYSVNLDRASGQYFSIADTDSLDATASGVSIAVWVKFASVDSTYQSIISKWDIGSRQQWTLQLNANNKIGWWTGDGGSGADNLESISTMSANTWYHIVVTSQGLSKKIYVNGTLEGSYTSSVAMGVASGVGVGVGAKTVGSPEYLDGLIDDARIYNYALSDSEASALAGGFDVPPDTTAPTAPGQPTTPTPTTDTTPTVSWTASSDSGVGMQNPAYTLEWSNSATFASITGSVTTNNTSATPSAGLTDGLWYFRVKAIDAVGNVATSSISDPVIVDTTDPTIPGTPNAGALWTNDNTPTYNWTASTDSGSGLAFIAYAVEWSQDTAFFGLGGTAGTLTNSYTIPDSLGMTDGTWYFRAAGIDAVGHQSPWSDYATVHIDTSAPSLDNIVATEGGAPTQEIITWTSDKETSSQVEYGLTSSLGKTTSETDISPRVQIHSVTLTRLVPCTTYRYTATSTDEAGNVTTSDTHSFTTKGCAASLATKNHSSGDASSEVVVSDDDAVAQSTSDDTPDKAVGSEAPTLTSDSAPKNHSKAGAVAKKNYIWWPIVALAVVVLVGLLLAKKNRRNGQSV